MIKTLFRKFFNYLFWLQEYKVDKKQKLLNDIELELWLLWFDKININKSYENKSNCYYKWVEIIFYYWWLEFVKYFNFKKLKLMLDNLEKYNYIKAVNIKNRITFYTDNDITFSIEYKKINKMFDNITKQIENYYNENIKK